MTNKDPHPGVVLRKYINDFEMNQSQLARHIGVRPCVVNEIVNGKRGISIKMAYLLGSSFNTGPALWYSLHMRHKLKKAKLKKSELPKKLIA